jgi:hypothetical protein
VVGASKPGSGCSSKNWRNPYDPAAEEGLREIYFGVGGEKSGMWGLDIREGLGWQVDVRELADIRDEKKRESKSKRQENAREAKAATDADVTAKIRHFLPELNRDGDGDHHREYDLADKVYRDRNGRDDDDCQHTHRVT